MSEIACAECGDLFHRAGSLQMYCSRYFRDRGAGVPYPRTDKKKYDQRVRECKQCGVSFPRFGAKLFCSVSCQGSHRRKTQPEWYRERHRRNKPAINAKNRALYYQTRATAPWKILMTMARVRAKEKESPFDLTYEWCEKRWTGRCELTGLPFVLGSSRRGPFSPSIDQIEPKKGYTQSNARFILWAINSMKGEGTDEEMFAVAGALMAKRVFRTS